MKRGKNTVTSVYQMLQREREEAFAAYELAKKHGAMHGKGAQFWLGWKDGLDHALNLIFRGTKS